MSKRVKMILIIATVSGLIITPTIVMAQISKVDEITCPDGSYYLGQGVCKQEPTGCPYGDSIPLDSPKCVPPTATPTATPIIQNTGNCTCPN